MVARWYDESNSSLTCHVGVQNQADENVVVKQYATYPLRVVCNRWNSIPWIYLLGYGGGIVSGDCVSMRVDAEEESKCVVTTQSSTKILKAVKDRRIPKQSVLVNVENNATLCWAPEPITCFADSSFEQSQDFFLEKDSNLIYVDWITSGRAIGMAEHWDFNLYANHVRIFIDNELMYEDRFRLENNGGTLSQRMGSTRVLATLIVVGDQSLQHRLDAFDGFGISSGNAICTKSSLIDEKGSMLKIIGKSVLQVRQLLNNILEQYESVTGGVLYSS